MRVTYTYEGDDAAFEDAMRGVVETVAPARPAGRRRDAQGNTAVTLDVDLPGPSGRVMGALRTHERIIDVAQDGGAPEASFDARTDPVSRP